jgi:hypothetical protein
MAAVQNGSALRRQHYFSLCRSLAAPEGDQTLLFAATASFQRIADEAIAHTHRHNA